MYKKILGPTDGSECAGRGLEHAIKLAQAYRTRIAFEPGAGRAVCRQTMNRPFAEAA